MRPRTIIFLILSAIITLSFVSVKTNRKAKIEKAATSTNLTEPVGGLVSEDRL